MMMSRKMVLPVSVLKKMLACAGKPAPLVFMISGEPKAHDGWFQEK